MKMRLLTCVLWLLIMVVRLAGQTAGQPQTPSRTPDELDFDKHIIGTRTAPIAVTVINRTGSSAKFTAELLNNKETNPDYQIETNECQGEIAKDASCAISVSFLPLGKEKRSGQLQIAYSTGSDQKSWKPLPVVKLTGMGFLPDLGISSTNLYFPGQQVSSVSTPQTVTLSNNSQKELVVSQAVPSGDFLVQTPTFPQPLKPGESLLVVVAFAPKHEGHASGILSILTANGSPLDVYLSGNTTESWAGLCFASPAEEIRVVTLLCVLYWLAMVIVRWHRVARPTRELLRAEVASLQTQIDLLPPPKPDDGGKGNDGPQHIKALLDKAIEFLVAEDKSRSDHIANFLFWSRGQEMTGWGYVHEAQVQMAALLAEETVRARLESAEQQLKGTTDAPCLALADSIHKALAVTPADIKRQKALLAEALSSVYDRTDKGFADLVSWQNKTAWLVSCGLVLIIALTGAIHHHSILFLVGAAGGLISRLSRSLDRKEVPTDYGASWTTLFLSPVAGGLGAWAGILLSGLAVKLNVLGSIFDVGWSDLCQPISLSIALVFGFSERLLDSILDKVVEKAPGSQTTATNRQPPAGTDEAAALKIVTLKTLKDGKVNEWYTAQLQASGGTGALTWSKTDGALPAGLELEASTGLISGKPSEAKTSTFTLRVTDKSSTSGPSQQFTITINP